MTRPIIVVDFETYFDTAIKYDLKNISMTEYINDPRFEIFGLGVMLDGESCWIPKDKVLTFLHAHDWSKYRIIGHNIKFDGAILSWKYGVKPLEWVDTKALAMAVLGSTIPSFSLKKLAEHLNLPAKGELNIDGKKILTADEEKELAEYCLRDVEITQKLYEKLMISFPPKELDIMDWTIRAFVEPKLVINKKLARQIVISINTRKELVLNNTAINKKVFASNQQFAEYLKSLGYELPMKKNPKGVLIPALAMGDPEFLAMCNSSDEKLKQICLVRKEVKKTMEVKRAEKLQKLGDLYPFDIVFSGATQTHRFSGGSGAGGNPQNFPKDSDLRACLEAPEGYRLFVGDFKSIELRILAFLSRDKGLMDAIINGEDIYAGFASKIFQRLITKTDEKERQFGKAAILGLGYNMGVKKFAQTVALQDLKMPGELVKQTVYLFRNTYKAIPRFWDLCGLVIKIMTNQNLFVSPFPSLNFIKVANNTIILPSGLEVRFPNLRKEDDEWIYDKYSSKVTVADKVKLYGGKLAENICQALAGEVCKESIRRLLNNKYPPVGQVHDELLVLSPMSETGYFSEILKKAMTNRLPWWPELILETEIGEGKNWKDAKGKGK
jgi:DNA polymerase